MLLCEETGALIDMMKPKAELVDGACVSKSALGCPGPAGCPG